MIQFFSLAFQSASQINLSAVKLIFFIASFIRYVLSRGTHQSPHRLFVLDADSLIKEAAQAASHSFGAGVLMKSITANFYNLFRAFFSLILIVLMLYPASFAGAISTVRSKTNSFQKTWEWSTVRRAKTLAPMSAFSALAAATTTSVTSSVNSNPNNCQPGSCFPVFGQPVTFTATVSTAGFGTPTGLVQFFDNGNPIGGNLTLNGSGQAQLTTSTLSVGSHTITAQYAGNVPAGFNASSGSLNSNPQTVTLAPTAATVSISRRVTTMSGRGIQNVHLSLTDSNGKVRTATTTSFG